LHMAPRDYDRERYRRPGGYRGDERGLFDRAGEFLDRAGQEVRSWLSPEEAERRRRRDEPTGWQGSSGGYDRAEYDEYGQRGSGAGRGSSYGEEWSRSGSGRAGSWGRYDDREHGRDFERGYGSERSFGSGREGAFGSGYDRSGSFHESDRPGHFDSGQGWSGRTSGFDREGSFGGYGRGSSGYGAGTATSAPWAGAGPHAGRGPRGYQRSDERIREDVYECLTQHGHIDASGIEADVSGGVVTLRGTVESRQMRRLAEEAVEEISGVKDVRNELRALPPGMQGDQAWGSTPGQPTTHQGSSASPMGTASAETQPSAPGHSGTATPLT